MQEPIHNILDCLPAGTPEWAAPAWLGALAWALGGEEVLDQYRQETGDQWRPAITAVDRMIDEATGRDWQFVEAFAKWFNVNFWGEFYPEKP